jgi:hypothetical protein
MSCDIVTFPPSPHTSDEALIAAEQETMIESGDTAPKTTPTRTAATNKLENALAEIEELAGLLLKIGNDGGEEDRHLVYLGHRLEDHQKEAYDAFCVIYGYKG